MQKRFEIMPRRLTWEVRHNWAPICRCKAKSEAIRAAVTLSRMQRRMGDDCEIVVCDETGASRTRHRILAIAPGAVMAGA